MNTWQNPETEIKHELGDKEQMLWAGRPRLGLRFRQSDMFMIPFSLMWGGFAIFWEFLAIKGNAPFFFMLWGIPFVVMGLYMIFGRFIVDAKQREQTIYGVTDQRVIIISGLTSRKVKSLNLRTLSDMSLSEKNDRSGTITFGPGSPTNNWWAGSNWPGMQQQTAPSFEMISEAKKVYDKIRDAQVNV